MSSRSVYYKVGYIKGLAQDCSNSIANALELLQSCTKASIFSLVVNDFGTDDIIQNSYWNLMKPRGTQSVNLVFCHSHRSTESISMSQYDKRSLAMDRILIIPNSPNTIIFSADFNSSIRTASNRGQGVYFCAKKKLSLGDFSYEMSRTELQLIPMANVNTTVKYNLVMK